MSNLYKKMGGGDGSETKEDARHCLNLQSCHFNCKSIFHSFINADIDVSNHHTLFSTFVEVGDQNT